MMLESVFLSLVTFVLYTCGYEMKKLAELSNILVVDHEEGSIKGVLCDCLLDLSSLEVMGWTFRRDGFFRDDGFVWQEHIRIGKEVAFVTKIHDMPAELSQWHSWGKSLRKNIIMDRSGKEVGHVRDILFQSDFTMMEGIEIEEGRYIDCHSDLSVRNTVVVVSQDIKIEAIPSSQSRTSWWERLLGKDVQKKD